MERSEMLDHLIEADTLCRDEDTGELYVSAETAQLLGGVLILNATLEKIFRAIEGAQGELSMMSVTIESLKNK